MENCKQEKLEILTYQPTKETMKEKIEAIRKELESDVTPTRASEIAIRLSAYWAFINEELVKREMDYNTKLLEVAKGESTYASAKVIAQASEEYKNWLEYRSFSKSLMEMIRTCNRYVRRKEIEWKEGRYG